MTPQKVKLKIISGPKMEYLGEGRQQSQEAGAILKALVSKMAPRWPREAQDS